jgi:predicted nucleotidyltransferase
LAGDDYREIVYDERRWRILAEKREKALAVMKAIIRLLRLPVITHGSIARGDVREDSDVDIVILETPRPLGLVDLALETAGFEVVKRVIVQATPGYTPKVYYYLDWREEVVVSYPLARLKPREREFYKWGGEIDVDGLKDNRRVPGVNKDLRLIVPKPWGHVEVSVRGREGLVARMLGISPDTVEERVRVLTRRREVGRTGVFIEREIPKGISVEEAVKRLALENKAFRKAIDVI